MKPTADHGEESYEGTGKLEGHKALITGADSGIGRAVALAFAREGAHVAISYLSEEEDARETERLVKEAGCKAILLPGDIGEASTCEEVARDAIDASAVSPFSSTTLPISATTKNSRRLAMMSSRKLIG